MSALVVDQVVRGGLGLFEARRLGNLELKGGRPGVEDERLSVVQLEGSAVPVERS